jgi:hypothetical protein
MQHSQLQQVTALEPAQLCCLLQCTHNAYTAEHSTTAMFTVSALQLLIALLVPLATAPLLLSRWLTVYELYSDEHHAVALTYYTGPFSSWRYVCWVPIAVISSL